MEDTVNNNLKICLCGCGTKIPAKDKYGIERFYALNHHRKNKPSPNRKNYRILVDGYWYLYLPNHPLSTKRGYYCEHRKVMEDHIGRILRPEEEIHHINYNRQDNRIENLKLYSSRNEHIANEHGPTRIEKDRRCCQCGSDKTGMNRKKSNGKWYPKWLKKGDDYICLKCYDYNRNKK